MIFVKQFVLVCVIFCSRDPIGYKDGENSFAYIAPLFSTDPSGQFRIYGWEVQNGTCSPGSFAQANFAFVLEQKAECELLVLQEVEVSCSYNNCKDGCDPFTMQSMSQTYVEARRVAKGTKVVRPRGKGGSSTTSTDIAKFGDFHDKCGRYHQFGRILLICVDTLIGGRKVEDIVEDDWSRPVTIFAGTYCETSSGVLPGTIGAIPEEWWRNAYDDQSPAWSPKSGQKFYSHLNQREFIINFDCCCGSNSVDSTVTPNRNAL